MSQKFLKATLPSLVTSVCQPIFVKKIAKKKGTFITIDLIEHRGLLQKSFRQYKARKQSVIIY